MYQCSQEVLRINLRNVILELKAIGIENIFEFDFLDKPAKENFVKAYEELIIFNALDSNVKFISFYILGQIN